MSPGKKRHVVVTAGPTREPIDPVRYLSNESSGRMGFEIAAAAARHGDRVTLIAGPVHLRPRRGSVVSTWKPPSICCARPARRSEGPTP